MKSLAFLFLFKSLEGRAMYFLKIENKCTLYFSQAQWEQTHPDYIALAEGTLQGVVILRLVDRRSPCSKKLFLSDEENKAREGFYIIVQRVNDFKDYQNFLKGLNTS